MGSVVGLLTWRGRAGVWAAGSKALRRVDAMRTGCSRVLLHLAAVVIIVCSCATTQGEGQKGDEPDSAPMKEIGELIKKLGSEAFEEREAAEKKLAKIGAAAKGHLATAAKSKDPEVARRAGAILAAIRKEEMAKVER